MTDKQLRALSKTQLFDLLHKQELEIERLTEDNAKLTEQKLTLQQAGSLAEASLMVTGIMEAAQSAADIYLDSIRKVEAEKIEEVAKLEEEAKVRALRTVERKNAELRTQMERLVVDMMRVFDTQVNSMAAMKEELSELIDRNDLKHLIPGNVRTN